MVKKIPSLPLRNDQSDRPENYSVYYFLHIPKTAGTSFAKYLRSHYGKEDAMVPQTWNELYAYYEKESASASLQEYINNHQLIIGHYGAPMLRYILGPIKTLTILRNPFDRTLSQLCHIKNEPTYNNWVRARFIFPHENITHAIEDGDRLQFFENYQLRYLANSFDYMKEVKNSGFYGADLLFDSSKSFRRRIPESELIHKSREVLQKCFFVGVQDYIEEAMLLLAYKSGWPPPLEVEHLTSTTDKSQVELLSEEHKTTIHNLNKAEYRIYEEYKKKFEDQYLAFINHILKKEIKQWKTFMRNREAYNQRIRKKLIETS